MTMPAQTAPTLRDDWQARRRQLLASTTLPRPYVRLYVRLLDYLLQRYGDTDVGAQPALFPHREGAECNLRAVLVHQHLARGRAGKHQGDAARRVGSILGRMAGHEDAPEAGESDWWLPADVPEPGESAWWRPQDAQAWRPTVLRHELLAAIERGDDPADPVRKLLHPDRITPRPAAQFLSDALNSLPAEGEAEAAAIEDLRHRLFAVLAVHEWRLRIRWGGTAKAVPKLEWQFLHGACRDAAHDELRLALADESLDVRLRAAWVIQRLRDVNDVSLLMDLLALEEVQRVPAERQALSEAAEDLARAEDDGGAKKNVP